MDKESTVCVVGMDYVGLPLAVEFDREEEIDYVQRSREMTAPPLIVDGISNREGIELAEIEYRRV